MTPEPCCRMATHGHGKLQIMHVPCGRFLSRVQLRTVLGDRDFIQGKLPLPRPPCCRTVARGDLCPPQRDQVTTLVRIAPDLRAVLAAHVPLQFVDRRRLRSTDNVERDRRMGVAAEAPDLKVAVTGVEHVSQRW
jgi:hypothetical protein